MFNTKPVQQNIPTIAAIATAAGEGGIGIVRLSGPLAQSIGNQLCRQTLRPRYAHFSVWKNLAGEHLDEGISLFFPAPHSYTGEDVLELQGHGGRASLQSLLHTVLQLGATLARAGEFSERAFINGRLDLLQAEAIADLISARSEQARKAALASLSGEFSKRIQSLQEQLIYLRTYVEAALDFSDEEIDFLAEGQIGKLLDELHQTLDATLSQAKHGKQLRDGVTVVITGRPNAGKSSLMNYLLGEERAIVTDEAGTTRDTLQETFSLQGIAIHLIDTAGLREATNKIEKIGIERAKSALEKADLAIWLRDIADLSDSPPDELKLLPYLEVHNKADLSVNGVSSACHSTESVQVLQISAKTGLGIEALCQAIADKAGLQQTDESIFSARTRHIEALELVIANVVRAKQFCDAQLAPELLAEELRQAQQALSEITGEYYTDDLLGSIFAGFCIGK